MYFIFLMALLNTQRLVTLAQGSRRAGWVIKKAGVSQRGLCALFSGYSMD